MTGPDEMMRNLLQGKDAIELLRVVTYRGEVLGYAFIASYVWMIYDWVITFSDEYRLVWGRRWGLGKTAYVILRIYGFTFQTFNLIITTHRWNDINVCNAFWWTLAICSLLLLFMVELILMGRVYAMYRCSRKILIMNLACFTATIGCTTYIFSQQLPQVVAIIAPSPLRSCWALYPSSIWIIWLPAFCMELWLWLLVVWKAREHAKRFATDERKAIVTLLIRDSIIWFAVGIAFVLWNIIGFRFIAYGFSYMGVPFFHTAVSIGGTRMMLNIREAYYQRKLTAIRPSAGPLGMAYDLGVLGYEANRKRYTIQGIASHNAMDHEDKEDLENYYNSDGLCLRVVREDEALFTAARIDIAAPAQEGSFEIVDIPGMHERAASATGRRTPGGMDYSDILSTLNAMEVTVQTPQHINLDIDSPNRHSV